MNLTGRQVIRLGNRLKGQIVRSAANSCEVLWGNGKRENCSPSELAWVGLTVHTCDGRPGRVMELGRSGNIRVRLSDGACHWMHPDELAPRVPAPQMEMT